VVLRGPRQDGVAELVNLASAATQPQGVPPS
jgi:hypothetical protein